MLVCDGDDDDDGHDDDGDGDDHECTYRSHQPASIKGEPLAEIKIIVNQDQIQFT